MIGVGLVRAANPQGNLVAVHFWHGVEALGFLLVTLGGIGFVEWRERRRNEEPRPAAPAPTKVERQERTSLLTAAALCCAAAAGVHYVVMPDHFGESVLYGLFFLVTATSQVGYSILLIAKPSRPLVVVGLLANAAVVGLWLMTRLVAIPLGPGAGETEQFGALDILASSFEVLFLITATGVLFPMTRASMPRPRRLRRVLLEPATLAFITSAAVLIGVTAYAAPPS
jgi:hypothetical protein